MGLDAEGDLEVGSARLRVRIGRPSAGETRLQEQTPQPEIGGQLELFSEGGRSVIALPPLEPPPAAAPVALPRLSYSALALYRRCGYRYFAQRVLGLPEPERERGEDGGLDALELGDAVHLELERPDGRWRVRHPSATDENSELITRLVENWGGSPLATRLAGIEDITRELAFAFEVDGVLFHGRIDIYARPRPDAALVVDFKTNRIGERSVEDMVDDSYGVQVATYALAALRAGAAEVEIAYAFLENLEVTPTRSFTAADAPRLEAELRADIDAIRAGQFPARPGFQCRDFPPLDLLCAGERLEWGE